MPEFYDDAVAPADLHVILPQKTKCAKGASAAAGSYHYGKKMKLRFLKALIAHPSGKAANHY
jgi:hypothetical protein